ncbi:MAG: phosphatidate cytidylyltransferase [Phycisphaerae bacterium]|jgi:phosphatidate cytidylyltransferase|nr:phosphatidate cytidylyltransferase [Phycisphaerae bacterium]
MLKHRLITGPLLSIALIAIVAFDANIEGVTCSCGTCIPNGLLIAILAALAAPFAAIELSSIAASVGARYSTPVLILTMEAWIATMYLLPANTSATNVMAAFGTIIVCSMALSVISLSKGKQLSGVFTGAAITVASSSYIALGFGFLLLIRKDHSAWWILGIIAIIKMCDTGAFFVGSNLGKHKLIPWISPGKTWEGLIGGLLTAGITALLLAMASDKWLPAEPHISMYSAFGIGLMFGFLGQAGDLVMSVFKRDSGLKDASNVLPGLGGVLDVLDSLLLVGPAAYWLLS